MEGVVVVGRWTERFFSIGVPVGVVMVEAESGPAGGCGEGGKMLLLVEVSMLPMLLLMLERCIVACG